MATDPGMLTDWYQSYMKTKPETTQATATAAGTTDWTPDKNSTVQGQLTNVLDAGGPLMDRAATKASQVANGRGLLNSSIAVGAGQAALYDAALPIAQQDATVHAQAGQFNAGAKNTAALSNANALNQTSQFNATAQNAAEGQQRGAGIASEQTAQQVAEAGAARDFTAGQAALDRTQQTTLQATDIANQNAMQSKDLSSRYDLASMDMASRAALQKADAENQQKLQQANAALQTGLQATDSAVKQSMQQYQLSVQQAMAGKDNETKLQLAKMDADTQTNLADLNNTYRVQLQASQSMAASYQSYVDAASRVMVDPNMDLIAKQYQLDNLARLYNNTLKMQSNVTGLNLGELLVEPTPTPPPEANAPAPAPAPSYQDPESDPGRNWGNYGGG